MLDGFPQFVHNRVVVGRIVWIVAAAAVFDAFAPPFYVVGVAKAVRKAIHGAIAEQAVKIP